MEKLIVFKEDEFNKKIGELCKEILKEITGEKRLYKIIYAETGEEMESVKGVGGFLIVPWNKVF